MSKIIYLGIAIVAIGLIALPETLSLFAGQHNWYAIDQAQGSATGQYGIPCEKCHADVATQMSSMAPGAAHSTGITCESCHIVSQLAQGATVGGDKQIHAATSPECMDCHDGAYVGAPKVSFSEMEAHRAYINASEESTLMAGANEACVSCHTHVAVDITWSKPTTLIIIVNGNNTNISMR